MAELDLDAHLGRDIDEMSLTEYAAALRGLTAASIDVSRFGGGAVYDFPFARHRGQSTATWDDVFDALVASFRANMKSFTTRELVPPLYGELDAATWDRRLGQLAPFFLQTLTEGNDIMNDGMAVFAAQLWWMKPIPDGLRAIATEIDQKYRHKAARSVSEKRILAFLLRRDESEGVSLEQLHRDPFQCMLDYLTRVCRGGRADEARIFLANMHQLPSALLLDGRTALIAAVETRLDDFYEALFSALDLGDEDIALSVSHWAFANGRLLRDVSTRELAIFARHLGRFLAIAPGFAISVLRVARECSEESPELLAALDERSRDASLLSDARDMSGAARLLYLYRFSPVRRAWSADVARELLERVHGPLPVVRAASAYLIGLSYAANPNQSPPLADVCAQVRAEEARFAGVAGPFIEGVKKAHADFPRLTGTTLFGFGDALMRARTESTTTTTEMPIDLHRFWWELALPTLGVAMSNCPAPAAAANTRVLPNPTQPAGGDESLPSEVFTGDPALQSEVALTALNDRFDDLEPFLVCHTHDEKGDEVVYVDPRESGQTRRMIYAVRFDHARGPRQPSSVRLSWTETLELYDAALQQTHHLHLPAPIGSYPELAAVRVVDEGVIHELSVPSPENAVEWKSGYRPNRMDSAVDLIALKLGEEWHETLEGLLITWEDFLRSYGVSQSDDWANDIRGNLDGSQKRKFVLSAIREKDLIPFGALPMIGVGPLEDILSSEVMGDLEALERETTDPEIRSRLCEVISGIYVHGDPLDVRCRWISLVRSVAPPETIASLTPYFESLLADAT